MYVYEITNKAKLIKAKRQLTEVIMGFFQKLKEGLSKTKKGIPEKLIKEFLS